MRYLLPLLFALPAFADVTVVDRAPVTPANAQYVANRKPLQPSSLVRLPPGSVKWKRIPGAARSIFTMCIRKLRGAVSTRSM